MRGIIPRPKAKTAKTLHTRTRDSGPVWADTDTKNNPGPWPRKSEAEQKKCTSNRKGAWNQRHLVSVTLISTAAEPEPFICRFSARPPYEPSSKPTFSWYARCSFSLHLFLVHISVASVPLCVSCYSWLPSAVWTMSISSSELLVLFLQSRRLNS